MAITRRSFLKKTLAACALTSCTPMMPEVLVRAGHAAQRVDQNDRILVVLQLTGGNDGLNTVVPYTDDVYARSRPTLRLPTGQLHRINDQLAFHPRMEAFSRLYKEGHLSVVQGVGCPNPSDDHEKAMRIWHRADPDEQPTGWLGRTSDHVRAENKSGVPVAFVSAIRRPFILTAEQDIIPRIDTLDKVTLARQLDSPVTASSQGNPLLSFLQASSARSRTMSQRISEASQAQAGHVSRVCGVRPRVGQHAYAHYLRLAQACTSLSQSRLHAHTCCYNDLSSRPVVSSSVALHWLRTLNSSFISVRLSAYYSVA